MFSNVRGFSSSAVMFSNVRGFSFNAVMFSNVRGFSFSAVIFSHVRGFSFPNHAASAGVTGQDALRACVAVPPSRAADIGKHGRATTFFQLASPLGTESDSSRQTQDSKFKMAKRGCDGSPPTERGKAGPC
jgi:hypothetical protein